MANPFRDQAKFMQACDQSTDTFNEAQYKLYCDLIEEEYNDEFKTALANNNRVEQLDALIDILVVTIGAIHSAGFDAEGAWREVMRSNLSKIDKETGKVRKREDGKVLKPINYSPPVLEPFITKK
jgi:predicted HAD superfamily Cof-like phosphohydrolase